jgi:hypothetical protein
VIHSRRLNIGPYLKFLESLIPKQKTELLKMQTRDYIQFVRGMIELQNVMSKSFYVSVPMSRKPAEKLAGAASFVEGLLPKKGDAKGEMKEDEYSRLHGQLVLRIEQVIAGLRAIGLKGRQLDSEELFYLFANLYSPGVVKKQMPISREVKGFN